MKFIVSALVAAIMSTSTAFAEEVRVYNWSDYIDEALLEKFEQETGIELIYDVAAGLWKIAECIKHLGSCQFADGAIRPRQ